LEKYKSLGSNQIPAELIQAEIKTLQSEIHKLILFGVRKNFLISGRSLLSYQFMRRVIKQTAVIMKEYYCYQLHAKFYLISFTPG
jgi:hypothetical protein